MATRVATLFLLGLIITAGIGCGDKNEPAANTSATPGTTATPSGESNSNRLVIKGSDTLLPLSQQWAEKFKAANAGADVTVTGGGSGTGLVGLINGTCEIANSSRPAKDSEKTQAKEKGVEMVETPVARDGITIIVHPSNKITSLTLEQLAGIYTGKINNWKEVGGADLKIIASGRDSASGTYAYFQEDVLAKEKYRADMISTPSNNAIANNVASQEGGIGYIGVAYASAFTKAGKVREVPIAFKSGDTPVLPTEDNILSGKYPISRALFNYTNGQPKGVAAKYLEYVTGPDGQKVVEDLGFVPLKKAN